MNESFCDDYVGQADALEDTSPGLEIFTFVILMVGIIIIIGSYARYLLHWRKYENTRRRNFFLLTLFAIGSMILLLHTCIRIIIGVVNFSCRVYSLVGTVHTLLLLQTCWVRLFSLLWRINFNKILIDQTFLAFTEGKVTASPSATTGFENLYSNDQTSKGYYSETVGKNGEIKLRQSHEKSSGSTCSILKAWENCETFFFGFIFFDVLRLESQLDVPLNIRVAAIMASTQFATWSFIIVFGIEIIVFLAVEFYFLPLGIDCINCSTTPLIIVSFGLIGLSVFGAIYVFFRLRRAYDSFGIRKEIMVLGAAFLVTALVFPLRGVFPEPQDNGTFDYTLLVVLIELWMVIYVFPYQIYIAKKASQNTNRAEDDENLLEKLLEIEKGKKAFALYLACSLSLENLLFYTAVDKWKTEYSSNDMKQNQIVAEKIDLQFLREASLLTINISDGCRRETRKSVEENLDRTTFDEALRAVWVILTYDQFQRFKKTAYYKAVKNELQNY